MSVESDIEERVRVDFPPDAVAEILRRLESASANARTQRCIVFAARGHLWYFNYLCRVAKRDFRDVILAAEYDRFDIRLYDFTKPLHQARIDDPYATNKYGPDPTKI
ncbi:MAG TPA: hypothetical protein PLX89_27305 [Verrucomicrobiota bacterium]|nr:hypothetical protein [Verrucomicrobiales bacterium]HRI16718.1 hypothetical protein [Verrucomicrobiota bacterium]